jgi:hypothetical protein
VTGGAEPILRALILPGRPATFSFNLFSALTPSHSAVARAIFIRFLYAFAQRPLEFLCKA